jgi:hypothetical protein
MFVCAAAPALWNTAWGVAPLPVGTMLPGTGTTMAAAAMSLAGAPLPVNSSAPLSGAMPFGRASPSMSVVTPVVAVLTPRDSSRVFVPFGTCRSVVDVKGAALVVANDAPSFVAPADSVLL